MNKIIALALVSVTLLAGCHKTEMAPMGEGMKCDHKCSDCSKCNHCKEKCECKDKKCAEGKSCKGCDKH
jgi:hypothetical protein